MNIKHKLRMGFGLLFLVVLFFGGLSLFYIRVITNSNNMILNDNYATLKYVDEMRTALQSGSGELSRTEKDTFRKSLTKQQANVTEEGERQAVEALANDFNHLITSPDERERQKSRTNALYQLRTIAQLNLDAIERKSANAQDRIRNATIYLGGAACLTFVVLFSFVFNLAGFFEAPMQQVSAAMLQVARERTFQNRLDFDRSDEFGKISTAFNHMNTSLNRWDKERQAKIDRERRIAEILGEEIKHPIMIVDESQKVIFSNSSARALFDLKATTDPHLVTALETYENGPVTIKEDSFLLEIHDLPAPSTLSQLDYEDASVVEPRKSIKMYFFRHVQG